MSDQCDQMPVCIIGAGVAGLAAARSLHRARRPFVILEGAQRIGGRVFPFTFDGVTLQHGATYVNGVDNEIYEIAKAEGLLGNVVGDFESFSDFVSVRLEGEEGLTESDKADFTAFVKDLEEKYAELAESRPDLSLKQAFQEDFERFLESSSSRLSHRGSLSSLARVYLSFFEMEWAALADKLALANLSVWDDGTEGCDESNCLRGRGYGRVLEVLMQELPEESIRLNTTVTGINYESQDSVLLTLADGTQEEFSSVIVTSSLGFLKKHAATLFQPALEPRKMEAIDAIGFGDMQKLFLHYKSPFWREDELGIKTVGDASSPLLGRGNLFEVMSSHPSLLTLWLSGPAVAYAGARSDEELALEITLHLRKCLHNYSIEPPSMIVRHSWVNDPLVLGSYSSLTPASVRMGDANSILAQPILSTKTGRALVCFGGEATHSTFYQTTCGALLTGQREADRLISQGEKGETKERRDSIRTPPLGRA